jgi:hypothetical protein
MSSYAGPQVVSSNLILDLDAANPKSYRYAENLLTYSQGITSANGWGFGANTTFVSSSNTAPDGSNTATSTYGNGSSANEYIVKQSTYAANTWYTASCWARLSNGTTPTGGTILSISYTTDVLGTSTRSTVPCNGNLTSTWQRFSTTFFNVAPGLYSAFLCADQNNTATIEVWGAQVEHGNTMNQYTATTSSIVTSSNTWIDLSTYKNNGTLANTPGFSNTSTMSFSGFSRANNYVTLGNLPSTLPQMTVEVWVNIVPLINSSIGYIIGQRNSAFRLMHGSSNFQWACATTNNGWYTTGTTLTSSSVTVYNVWNHVVVTYDGSYNRIYVNGVLQGTSTPAVSGNVSMASLGGLYIMQTDSANLDNASGQLSVARIYSTALTQEQIVSNFNAMRGRYGL